MHYRPRLRPPKVETEKFEIDFRLLDLLDITSKRYKISKNNIFEQALLSFLKDQSLPLKMTRHKKKKFLARKETLSLLESKSNEYGISKNAIVNKSLKEFLVNKPFLNMRKKY